VSWICRLYHQYDGRCWSMSFFSQQIFEVLIFLLFRNIKKNVQNFTFDLARTGSRRGYSQYFLNLLNHIKKTKKNVPFLSINQNKIGIEKFPDLIASNVETLTHYFVNCRDFLIVIWHASSTLGLSKFHSTTKWGSCDCRCPRSPMTTLRHVYYRAQHFGYTKNEMDRCSS